MRKSYLTLIIISVILIIGLVTIPRALLGKASSVALEPAPTLTGQVSQALVSGHTSSDPPVAGKDYKLAGVIYFYGQTWLVADIVGLNNAVSNGIVVMQKHSGIFQVVMGPGTAFDNSYVRNLPTSVGDYLSQKGVTYDSVQ